MPRENLWCPLNWLKEPDGGSRLVAAVQSRDRRLAATKQSDLRVAATIHLALRLIAKGQESNRGITQLVIRLPPNTDLVARMLHTATPTGNRLLPNKNLMFRQQDRLAVVPSNPSDLIGQVATAMLGPLKNFKLNPTL